MKMQIFCLYFVSMMVCAHDAFESYQHVDCTLIRIGQKESAVDTQGAHVSHPHIPGPRSSRVPSNMATSTNWSGYAAQNSFSKPKKGTVTAVSGSWIVPALEATSDDSYCAFWVGIDGYSSPSVEQIGTSHNWINGAQQDYTWFEMYPQGAYAIGGFPLNPGDVISASVVYKGNSVFALTIMNDTQQVYFTVPTSYTRSSAALRQSAEWIVEAPYWNGILPLSDFVTAYMWGCMATINGITAPIKNKSWQNIGIEMITSNGTPKDVPSVLLPDNGSFFVTWAHE